MLETISETKSFKAPLPPSGFKKMDTIKPVHTKAFPCGKYGDDQDPSYPDGGEAYARGYYAQQTRKLMESMSPKGAVSPSSTAGSDQSEGFVCDMTSANEPLYGDPGEEEFYQY